MSSEIIARWQQPSTRAAQHMHTSQKRMVNMCAFHHGWPGPVADILATVSHISHLCHLELQLSAYMPSPARRLHHKSVRKTHEHKSWRHDDLLRLTICCGTTYYFGRRAQASTSLFHGCAKRPSTAMVRYEPPPTTARRHASCSCPE